MCNPGFPIAVKMMSQYGYQHCTHSKVNPSRLLETAHAGIYQRKAGGSIFPSLNHFRVIDVRHRFIATIYGSRFIITLYFKFLNEVAMPFEPGEKTVETSFMIDEIGVMLDKLIGLLDTYITPSQIWRDSAARPSAFEGL